MKTQVVTPEDGIVKGSQLRSGITQWQRGKWFYGTGARTTYEVRNLRMGKIFVIAVCGIILLISLLFMKSSPIFSSFIILFTLFALFHQLSFIRRQARIDHVDVDLTPREVVQETKEFHENLKTAARASAEPVFKKKAVGKFRRTCLIIFGITAGILVLVAFLTGQWFLAVSFAVVLVPFWFLFDGFTRMIVKFMGGTGDANEEEKKQG